MAAVAQGEQAARRSGEIFRAAEMTNTRAAKGGAGVRGSGSARGPPDPVSSGHGSSGWRPPDRGHRDRRSDPGSRSMAAARVTVREWPTQTLTP